LSVKTDREVGSDVGDRAYERLQNIKKVRSQLGKGFNVWNQQQLMRLTLESMNATAIQREVADTRSTSKKQQSAMDQEMFMAISVGIGLLAAIPTAGTSLAAVGIAATVVGAGISLYNLGVSLEKVSLASAANSTDFEKAKAISGEEPQYHQLALDIVGAIGDVFAAAAAFRAVKGLFAATKAGSVEAAIGLGKSLEQSAVTGASRSKILGEAMKGLPPQAIERAAKTMVTGTGLEAAAAKLGTMSSESQFAKEIQAAEELMQHVRGRIPDSARDLIKTGKVRPFTEASLKEVFGEVRGAKKWKKLQYASGFYSEQADMVFVRSGAKESTDLAGLLIHEATHRIGRANPFRGDNFMSEAVAEIAERDFYITLYEPGGPLFGVAKKTKRIETFLTQTDAQFLARVEKTYYEGKKALDPINRAAFKNVENASVESVVKEVFDDIYYDYQKSLPKMP
jgi:hypothetical protein